MKNEPHTFHLSQVSVMFELHKCSCRSDPWFYRGHSSHTSSISGDHRAVLPEARVNTADFGGWTEAGGGGGGREAWQQLLCAGWGGSGPSLLPVKDCPSNSRKPAQADLWDRHPSTPPHHHSCCQLHSLSSEQRGPPLVLSGSSFVPYDLVQPCGRAAAERNVQNTQYREEWDNMSLTHSQGRDFFFYPNFEKIYLKGLFPIISIPQFCVNYGKLCGKLLTVVTRNADSLISVIQIFTYLSYF